MQFMRCDLRSGFGRARRAVPIGLGILGILLPAVHPEAAAAAAVTAGHGYRVVTYRGYSFQVPRQLAGGQPRPSPAGLCPLQPPRVLSGHSPTQPGMPEPGFSGPPRPCSSSLPPARPRAPPTWDAVNRQVNVTAHGIRITATFDAPPPARSTRSWPVRACRAPSNGPARGRADSVAAGGGHQLPRARIRHLYRTQPIRHAARGGLTHPTQLSGYTSAARTRLARSPISPRRG